MEIQTGRHLLAVLVSGLLLLVLHHCLCVKSNDIIADNKGAAILSMCN